MSGDSKPGSRTAAPPRPILVDARRLDGGRALGGDFSYSVVAASAPRRSGEPSPSVDPNADKRHASRQRTRLRTGKIIDLAGRFVTECLVFDRSDSGSRLRLPVGVALPSKAIQLYDDQQDVLCQADVVWRLDREIGVRFRAAPATAQTRALADEMRRRYYAVPK